MADDGSKRSMSSTREPASRLRFEHHVQAEDVEQGQQPEHHVARTLRVVAAGLDLVEVGAQVAVAQHGGPGRAHVPLVNMSTARSSSPRSTSGTGSAAEQVVEHDRPGQVDTGGLDDHLQVGHLGPVDGGEGARPRPG